MVQTGVELCKRNSTGFAEDKSERLWFDVLDELVKAQNVAKDKTIEVSVCVGACRSVSGAKLTTSLHACGDQAVKQRAGPDARPAELRALKDMVLAGKCTCVVVLVAGLLAPCAQCMTRALFLYPQLSHARGAVGVHPHCAG